MSEFTADSDMTDENIATVKDYIAEFPDQRQRVLDAEREGQNRTTLVAWLEEEQPTEEQPDQATLEEAHRDQPATVPDPNPMAPEQTTPVQEFRSP